MEKLTDLIKEIKTNNAYDADGNRKKFAGSSKKDEVKVMRSMLNDTSFVVGIYNNEGLESEYCPAETAKNLAADIIANATKITKNEAHAIADTYEFTNNDASKFIDISKEFVNTYTETGRKLNLGKRENCNVSLYKKDLEELERSYPKAVVDANGNTVYVKDSVTIPAHTTLKSVSKCPEHLKK